MDVKEERRENVLILAISGRLDPVASKIFQDTLLKIIDAGDLRLLVDFSGLNFIGSAGLRVFLMAAKKLEGEGGKLVLCSMKPEVRHVFDLPGFSSILAIYDTREEGLQVF